MIIYRTISGVKTILHDIEVDGQTELRQKISGEDVILSRFTVEENILDLQIGDFVEFKDSVYTILEEPNVKKSQNSFAYNLQFKSDQYILKNVQLINPDTDENEFFLFGDARDMISLIISNMNRVYDLSGEYYADYVELTESKNIGFNNENCLAALQKIATEFECEYSVKGKKITFRKKIGVETDLVFRYKKELREIERQVITNAEQVTVLYATGSERNITNDYGSKRLRIPVLEKNKDIFGTIERSITFEDIYPRLHGRVSTTPSRTKFIDTSIDFNINSQLIGGAKAKVIFNTGDLAGREFEIYSYNNTDKEIDIITYTDDSDLTLPNDILKPRVGDEYVLVNIKMPQEYIDNAEAELLEKATEYIDKYSQPNVIYRVSPHYPELRRRQKHVNLGDIIILIDEDFGIEFPTRILALTQKLNNEFEYSLEIGNQVTVSYFTQVMSDVKDVRNNIYQAGKYWFEQFNRIYNNVTGFTAPLYVNRGEFTPANYYYNNQSRRDYVFRMEGTGDNLRKVWYFYIGEDHKRAEWIQANWMLIGDQFEIIATETLLANNANIGRWLIQNGQIVSQALYDSTDETEIEPRVQLNGEEGYIKLVSGIDVFGNNIYSRYKQTILIDSRTGKITISRSGDIYQEPAEASFSSDGFIANFPGIDTKTVDSVPVGFISNIRSRGMAAVVAVGKGKLFKNSWIAANQFLAGVVGRVINTANNPAPAFGGVFWSLQSFGRSVGVTRVENATNYDCHIYDEFLSCYNAGNLRINLPTDPVSGRKIEVKRINSLVTVYGKIFSSNEVPYVTIAKGARWTFIWDGTYWLADYTNFSS